ncbi:MAG: hypothetical protein AAGE01_06655 [Pseudomonadota bacterium]
MINFLVTHNHRYTMDVFLPAIDPGVAAEIRVIPYDALRRAAPPPGQYLFADLERLGARGLQRATRIAWRARQRFGGAPVNDPERSLRRFELLRKLWNDGRNRFNAYRPADGESPGRYPVFVRHEKHHDGALTGLLADRDALDVALADLQRSGHSLGGLLVVEYLDASDEAGVFWKYGAFRIGEAIIPRHVFRGRSWVLKDPDLRDDATAAAEEAFLEQNPHEARLREIFDLACIQYGRIDYAVVDGTIQVWEINTNPVLVKLNPNPTRSRNRALFLARAEAAFRDLLNAQ